MKKLLSSIDTRIKYITNNSDNTFIQKECKVINIKLDDIRNKVIKTYSLLDEVCNRIISLDIDNMKRVPGQTNMVYKKMDELAGFILQIKDKYFETEDDSTVTESTNDTDIEDDENTGSPE